MSSPSDVKAHGVAPKIDGHAATRDPSPEDAFNCSSSDRPPKHTVRKPKFLDTGLSSIWTSISCTIACNMGMPSLFRDKH